MRWSRSPVGSYQKHAVKWGMLDVGRQTETEMDWCWERDLTLPTWSNRTQLNLIYCLCHHPEWQKKPSVKWEACRTEVYAPHLFMYVINLSGEDGSAFPSPPGLRTRGPRVSTQTWVSTSALCLSPPSHFNCPLQAMWVGQTDFLTQGFIWHIGEGKGIRLPRRQGQTLCFSFSGAVCHL